MAAFDPRIEELLRVALPCDPDRNTPTWAGGRCIEGDCSACKILPAVRDLIEKVVEMCARELNDYCYCAGVELSCCEPCKIGKRIRALIEKP